MPATFICKGCGTETRRLINGVTRTTFCDTKCRTDYEAIHGRGHRRYSSEVPRQYTCRQCGRTGEGSGRHGNRRQFCDPDCQKRWTAENRRRGTDMICPVCGVTFYAQASAENRGQPRKFHDRACMYKGRLVRVFARVRVSTYGYRQIWLPGHPRASDGYVFEHILVAEDKLGRPLTRKDEVHHVNRVKLDNRPENLKVLSASEHAKLHHAEDKAAKVAESWLY